ncbi:MAG: BON domain-containing protein [Acidobacteria bacterium]|nr:BON domain-containing protein [Acidobacteriota bacterium]
MKISVVASALLIAIAAQAGPDAKPAPSTQRSSSQPVASDAQIEKAIRARFAESKISTNKFQVRVQGGVATLEGKTEVLQHKGTATRLAKSAGAVRVINRIEVSDAAKQKAASNLATGRRRAQIKRGEVTGRR